MLNQKAGVSTAEAEKFKKKLSELLKRVENCRCVDCGSPKPNWASANLGVFICLTCSGIHRSLGVHISQVRSTSLDTWTRKQMQFIQCMDNIKANTYWEANLPPEFRRPSPNNRIELENFIRAKYASKKFVCPGPAPTLENFDTHPWFNSSHASPQDTALLKQSVPTMIPMPRSTPQQALQQSMDLLSIDVPQQAAMASNLSNDFFGDFATPNQPNSTPIVATGGIDTLQDPFQASNDLQPLVQKPHHQKSTSAPPPSPSNHLQPLVGLNLGSLPTTPSNLETQPSPQASQTNKLTADDIMSLYDKQSKTTNGGWDGDFFTDPSYKQKINQQSQQTPYHSRTHFQEGLGVGMGVGLPHAQSAPNLYGQRLQQGWQVQQQRIGVMGHQGGQVGSGINPMHYQQQQFF